MYPQLNIEPKNYIAPLLHLLIGLVNKAWSSLLFFIDEFVEQVSATEAAVKDKVKQCKELLAFYNEETDICVVHKNMAYAEIALTPSQRSALMPNITEWNKNIRQYAENKKKILAELKKYKALLAEEKKKRSGEETSMDNLLYQILEEHNIKRQHFHGGAMNGVCSRRLLDNTESIFEKI